MKFVLDKGYILIEMIKNFYKIGTPIEDIAKASNLSIDEINKIINSK